MAARERITLFDTTLRGPSARRANGPRTDKRKAAVARKWALR
jgi:hypothetical protein